MRSGNQARPHALPCMVVSDNEPLLNLRGLSATLQSWRDIQQRMCHADWASVCLSQRLAWVINNTPEPFNNQGQGLRLIEPCRSQLWWGSGSLEPCPRVTAEVKSAALSCSPELGFCSSAHLYARAHHLLDQSRVQACRGHRAETQWRRITLLVHLDAQTHPEGRSKAAEHLRRVGSLTVGLMVMHHMRFQQIRAGVVVVNPVPLQPRSEWMWFVVMAIG
jgi:hypothetical protein